MYTDSHKTLLQVILDKGAILDEHLKEFTFKLFPHSDVNIAISQINEQLNTINMTVKSCICEVSGQKYWTVISYSAITVEKAHLPFTDKQLKFLRSIFSEVITSGIGCYSSVESLNSLIDQRINMTKKEAEDFIRDLVMNKWLSTKEGYIFIGPRSLAELLNYFRENFPEQISDCNLCKQAIVYGKICPQCSKKTHFKCLQNYAKAQKNVIKCPLCNHNFETIDEDLEEQIRQYLHSHAAGEMPEDTLQPQDESQSDNSDESMDTQ